MPIIRLQYRALLSADHIEGLRLLTSPSAPCLGTLIIQIGRTDLDDATALHDC
jgi:hypothetical protein